MVDGAGGGAGVTAVDDATRALAAADAALAHHDVDGLVAHLSTAIRAFTAAGDRCRAAMACVRLGDAMAHSLGNLTAARAWFVRAERLVEDQPPCLEQGWVAVASLGCNVDDPARLLASAELALDRARRFGDVNLETKALADGGLALVQAGRVREGMAMLDEAMALACGPADDADAAAKSVCSFFTACCYAGDFERAGSWAQLLRLQGLIGAAPGPQVFLTSHCESVQATALIELGRWTEAEAVLERARAAFAAVMPTPAWHPDVALADLRVRQGRLAEAEALLIGRDQSIEALLPAARLHLARRDVDLAGAAAARGLRALGSDRLRTTELLTVLVDVELARGNLDAARATADELLARSHDLDVPALRARAAAAAARVEAARGDPAAGAAAVEVAVDSLDPHQLPWLRALLLVDLARLRDAAGDPAAAAIDARAALAALAPLDVVVAPEDRALLARLTAAAGAAAGSVVAGAVAAPAHSSASSRAEAVLQRDGRWWTLTSAGTSVRLPDTKGLRYVADLVEHAGVERHALDLVDRVEGVSPDGIDRRSLGDAGEVLDARARHAYRHRIEARRSEIDDHLAAGRLEEAERAQDELDALVTQLAQAFGVGGRSRVAASAVERARLNVTRATRSAVARIREVLPEAGAVLDRRIRTGTYCAFTPEPDDTVRWIVQPGVNGTGRR